jgi:hypothetical protein
MKTVYFDTNVYRHIHKFEDGITEADVRKLKALIRADKVRILLSTQVVEETISAVPSVPKEALARLRLMRALAKRKRIIKYHTQFTQGVLAYAKGEKLHSLFIAPPPMFRRILKRPNLDELREIAAETKASIQEHHNKISAIFVEKIEPLAGPIRKQKQQPTFQDYWTEMAIHYIEELAKRTGVLDECKNQGLEGLLKIRCFHIATLGQLSLLYANMYEGRKPKFSDSRDLQHVLLSSATDALITNDSNLRRIMTRMSVDDYAVMSFKEMMNRID